MGRERERNSNGTGQKTLINTTAYPLGEPTGDEQSGLVEQRDWRDGFASLVGGALAALARRFSRLSTLSGAGDSRSLVEQPATIARRGLAAWLSPGYVYTKHETSVPVVCELCTTKMRPF
ncbi:hypothetical protein CMQ_3753 [Grosmannia clavigera kw1407]|uniref:Uncharacterized protein n=1 Tax=Grosmannia clavigera (strain kw1407 / UAMH 11150) TaxID=655863 RepID=F0XAJ6_GROCL|nr:uncharacterized protein CMQ_3753 [Grosmannia clavigera kw1407]EFX05684.1 hypothetical protein CMQ_3753 [Grosmannia clavigera kw1407]